jgi:hypothetical protein
MRQTLFILVLCFFALAGCKKAPVTDYSSLDQSGMWSSNLDQLKKLKVSDSEIAQLTKLKQSGASDEFCLALLKAARDHQHDFASGNSAVELSRAGYSDAQILEMANSDQIDILSGEAVTLKLIGLSNSTVQQVMHRRVQGLPTLTSAQIGRLKNTGMTEKQVLDLINRGLSDKQAEIQIAQRESSRNHSHTEFVHDRGRRSR